MPTYTIRQRLVTFSRGYRIENEAGELVLRLDGKARFARTFAIKARAGTPLLAVREKLLTIEPTYVITRGAEQVAVVRRRSTSGAPVDSLTIDLSSGGSMEATGKLWSDEGVRVMRGATFLASVRRRQHTVVREVFEVETVPTVDQALMLAIAMSIAETDPLRGRLLD